MKWPRHSAVVLICATGFALPMFFQNCSKVDFAAAGEETSSDSSVTPDQPANPDQTIPDLVLAPGTAEARAIFETSQKPPLDMIWVIDNSGSMGDKAAQVRQNFAGFMDKVKNDANIRLALISKPHQAGNPNSTGVSLSAEMKAAGHIHIEQNVESYDAPIILSNTLCQPPMNYSSTHPCAKIPDSQEQGSPDPRFTGALANFLRPNSQKVVVFVSDEDSVAIGSVREDAKPMTSTSFLHLFKTVTGQLPVVYGWVGLVESDCAPYEGKAYKEMAATTGGLVFDVCQANWSGHFDTLARTVTQQLSRNVQLTHPKIEGIVMVTVNGRALGPSEYTLNGNRVEIGASALTGADRFDVRVTYRYQP